MCCGPDPDEEYWLLFDSGLFDDDGAENADTEPVAEEPQPEGISPIRRSASRRKPAAGRLRNEGSDARPSASSRRRRKP